MVTFHNGCMYGTEVMLARLMVGSKVVSRKEGNSDCLGEHRKDMRCGCNGGEATVPMDVTATYPCACPKRRELPLP
jgi:hypothetical protein